MLVIAGLVTLINSNLLTIQSEPLYYMSEGLLDIVESIPLSSADESQRVLADNDILVWIPSLRWNLHSVLWRNTYFQAGISIKEQNERTDDYRRFFAEDLSLTEMNDLMNKYEIRYIILNEYTHPHLVSLIESSSEITFVRSNGRLRLWQVAAD
jgi:hypothetical protein